MPWAQEWTDQAKAKFGDNVEEVKTKEILTNAQSGTALHGEGDRVFGFARDSSERNKNQIWAVLVHRRSGGRILVNEATGTMIIANGHNAQVTLGTMSIDDKRVQWEATYSSWGIRYRNMEYRDCYLNLAAGNAANHTAVYAHVSCDKNWLGAESNWHKNASWTEKHLSPGEI